MHLRLIRGGRTSLKEQIANVRSYYARRGWCPLMAEAFCRWQAQEDRRRLAQKRTLKLVA